MGPMKPRTSPSTNPLHHPVIETLISPANLISS
ncbi:hypothetical protein Gohar_016953, partial [Gossypium harknessii]|nr:hypothetical protein [Gossypium harknessii]